MVENSDKPFYEAILNVLLSKGHCSLENLGTLYLFKTTARINTSTHTLIPPKTEARFNPGIRHADPFIVPTFCKISGLSEKDAMVRIRLYTNHIRQWLDWKKEVRLPGIGTIISDEINNYYLISELIHPEDIGKKNIFIKELSPEKKSASFSFVNEQSSSPLNINKTIGDNHNDSDTNKSENTDKKIFFIPYLRAASFLLFFLLTVLFLWFLNKKEWNRQQIYMASVLNSGNEGISYQPHTNVLPDFNYKKFTYPRPTLLFNENGLATVNIHGIDFKVGRSQPVHPFRDHNNFAPPVLKPSESFNTNRQEKIFYIIAGSFSLPENAKKFLKTLKNKGYHPTLAGISPKGLQMVAISRAPTLELAETELQKIRREFSSAWILKP